MPSFASMLQPYVLVICCCHTRLLTNLEEHPTALHVFAYKYTSSEKTEALKQKTAERFQSSSSALTAVIEITLEIMTGNSALARCRKGNK